MLDLEKSSEVFIQIKNDFINRAEFDQLCNPIIDRNEKTQPNTFSTIPEFSSHIDMTQESCCVGSYNKDSISSHHVELDQYQTIDKLASFHFNEIEFEHECYSDS